MSFFDENKFTIEDVDGGNTDRIVYVLIFQQGGYLRERIQRVCESFTGKTFGLPEDGQGDQECFGNELQDIKRRTT